MPIAQSGVGTAVDFVRIDRQSAALAHVVGKARLCDAGAYSSILGLSFLYAEDATRISACSRKEET